MKWTFTGWEDAVDANRIAIVFEDRNKNYGAYPLRVFYHARLSKAFLISAAGFFIIAFSPLIAAWMSGKMKTEIKAAKEIVVNLTEPPPVDETVPPPPPPPPPPLKETVKFTPPKIVDKPVEEDQPPPQEKLSETTVSTVTQEGEKTIDLPPDNPVVDPDEGKIFTIVDEMPVFPGGDEKLYEFLYKNIKYPPAAREYGVHGKVAISFIVDRTGKISNVKIAKGIGSGCDEEALRVISMMPGWVPGKQNGRPVSVMYYLPVDFTLK